MPIHRVFSPLKTSLINWVHSWKDNETNNEPKISLTTSKIHKCISPNPFDYCYLIGAFIVYVEIADQYLMDNCEVRSRTSIPIRETGCWFHCGVGGASLSKTEPEIKVSMLLRIELSVNSVSNITHLYCLESYILE